MGGEFSPLGTSSPPGASSPPGVSDYISTPDNVDCINQWDCSLEFTRPAYGNLTLIGCGAVVAGRTDNDTHFLETLFVVWALERLGRLVPRNTSTTTASGTK